MPHSTHAQAVLLLVLGAGSLACDRAATAPQTRNPTDRPEPTVAASPMLQGVYAEAQPSDDTLLQELYVVFSGVQIRVGHRLLGEAADAAVPTAAKLCEVFFDTTIRWTPTGFTIATGVSAESQVGSLSVFLENEDASSGSFSFDGSSCEVQLVPGEYKVEPTREVGDDGRPLAFVLIPPTGAPQRFIAATPSSFQDLGQTLWNSLQQTP